MPVRVTSNPNDSTRTAEPAGVPKRNGEGEGSAGHCGSDERNGLLQEREGERRHDENGDREPAFRAPSADIKTQDLQAGR